MIQITITLEEHNGSVHSRADFTKKDHATQLELDVLKSWNLADAGGPIKAAVHRLLVAEEK